MHVNEVYAYEKLEGMGKRMAETLRKTAELVRLSAHLC